MNKSLLRLPLVLMLITVLTACTTTRTIVINTACDAFGPISFSGKHDTAQTVKEVREHNAAYASQKCPPKSQTDGTPVDK